MEEEPVRLGAEGGVAVVTLSNPPVNALSAPVRAGLIAALRAAEADPAVRAVVLAAEGRVFVAGADVTEFGKPPVPPSLPEVMATAEGLAKPVVAAIHGAALGGGLELAMACHDRVAGPRASLGLPEVKLGLLPGSGGTQRLPRLIGAVAALRAMTTGEPLRAEAAREAGLVSEVAEDPLAAARARALALAGSGGRPRARDAARLGPREAFEAAAAETLARARRDPAVEGIVACVRDAFERPFEAGLAAERERFVALRDSPRAAALRHAFLAERAAAKVPGLSGVRGRPVDRAAVVGAGTMGAGIALCFAAAGLPVTLVETDEAALERGLSRLRADLEASVRRGSLAPEARDERLARIEGRVGIGHAAGAPVVVEAVFEEMGLKKEVFSALSDLAPEGAVLASNTSYLDLDEIAASTPRPGDVVGMHFFSPAPVMRLLEVVRGAATSPEALATAVELGRRLGKVVVVVGVCHGFVGNRMLARRSAQAERLLQEGAWPEEVDAALTGFGFRMGPFAVADLAGLDVGWRMRRATGQRFPVADALVEAGRLGQKAGRGYHLYPEGSRAGVPDPEVRALIERVSAEAGLTRRDVPREEVLDRLLLPMINEGARILEEGIAARPGDVDLVWLHGYGWPAETGGPMFHADRLGLAEVARRLEALAGTTGDESLRPAPLLRRLAAEGRGFADLSEGRA